MRHYGTFSTFLESCPESLALDSTTGRPDCLTGLIIMTFLWLIIGGLVQQIVCQAGVKMLERVATCFPFLVGLASFFAAMKIAFEVELAEHSQCCEAKGG